MIGDYRNAYVIVQMWEETDYNDGNILCAVDDEEYAYYILQNLNTYNKDDKYEIHKCKMLYPGDAFGFYSICINYDVLKDELIEARTTYSFDLPRDNPVSKCYEYYDDRRVLFVSIERAVDDDLIDVSRIEKTLLEIARIESKNYQRLASAESYEKSPFGTAQVDVTRESLNLLEEALATQNYRIAIRKMRKESK